MPRLAMKKENNTWNELFPEARPYVVCRFVMVLLAQLTKEEGVGRSGKTELAYTREGNFGIIVEILPAWGKNGRWDYFYYKVQHS